MKRVRWAIVAAIAFVAAISFPAIYSFYASPSVTQPISTSGVTNSTTSTTTYASPNQICSGLPSTAIGNVTANPKNSHVYALIIEADPTSPYEGMNGSAYHPNTNWPVITVFQGQEVTIHIVNCPSSHEPHGFAIGFYFGSGIFLSPGQSYTLSFVANTVGRYTVFCNEFCLIHQLMQNGELLVKPMPSS